MLRRLLGKVDAWAVRHSERRPERNPVALSTKTILGVIVLPTALGLQPLPGSLEESAPRIIGQTSTLFVATGCLICVLGLLWPRNRDRGIAIEWAGCTILAAGLLFYAWALYQIVPLDQRVYATGLTLGLGVGCWARVAQITLYVRGRLLRQRLVDGGNPKVEP